jgi:hypothetical protein
VLPKQLAGLTLANDATTPATVLDIDVGSACSDDNTTMMVLSAANFTKNCNAAWAVSSGNGALDSGSSLAASTWYHVFLIERTDTQVVDVLISTSATSPTLPTSYTKKRRIGSVKTNASSQILAFTQVGDQFLWSTSGGSWNEYSNAPLNSVLSLFGFVFIPTGVKVIAFFHSGLTTPNATVQFQSTDNQFVANGAWCLSTGSGQSGGQFQVRTNTSAQIMACSNPAMSGGLFLNTMGWIDNRGK